MTTATSQLLPGSDATDYTTVSFIVAAALANMQTVSVCEVVAVNTAALTVDIKVLVNLMTAAGQSIPHGVISGRPYFRLQGGGNAIICDPVVGDIGTVVFGSRDLSGVIANKAAANPGSQRQFDWADGMYFGGILNGAPTQYMQFQASGGGINIVSPGTVAVQAPAFTASGTANIAGATTLQATLAVASTSTFTGMVTATAGITAPAGEIGALEVSSITPIGGGSFSTPTFPVAVSFSITGDGLTGTPLKLVNDSSTFAPSTAYYYGTNTAGVKGWYVLTGGGGGGGTVTSVGISTPGVGVLVGGGPITSAGTLTVDLSSTAYAALALAATALQSISIATGTGLTGGPLHASGSTVALANTAVTSGSYTSANITVDAQGRLTAASNGGGGSVTSVGISTPGVGVTVGGGPITAAGTLTVDLSSTAYAALALAVTALQSASATNSITGNGTSGSPLKLSGDTATPGNLQLYGTNGSGTKGWYAQPTGLPASPVQGDIAYYNGSAWVNLAPGTSGQILQTGGTSANPSWSNTLTATAGTALIINGAAVANTFSVAINGATPVASSALSNGLTINAGADTSDRPLDILSHSGAARLFSVFGDGSIITGGQALLGAGIINAAGLAIAGNPVYAGLPQHQFAGGTLTLGDANKSILNSGASQTFTIPANASVAYPVGTFIVFTAFPGYPLTIAINTDTLTWSPSGATGSRALAGSGIATALKIAATTWLIYGFGLT